LTDADVQKRKTAAWTTFVATLCALAMGAMWCFCAVGEEKAISTKEAREELRKSGVSWQTFLRILKLHTIDAIEWAIRGTLTWQEFLDRVSKSIERYGVKRGEG